MPRPIPLLLCWCLAVLLAAPNATAQDPSGRDTPGDWVVDHQRAFGLWDSFCDHRTTGADREERCYLRYVEVFSPRPTFAAQFVFVTPGPVIEFGVERGTRFDENGLRIKAGGAVIWSSGRAECLRGRACVYDGPEAEALLDAMTAGEVFAFDFIDRNGTRQALRWDLTRFAEARADFKAQADDRGL